jgi:hypothetical protein
VWLGWTAGFLIPLKAARFDVAGLSLYFSYIVAAVVFVRYHRRVLGTFTTWFMLPMLVLALFAGWGIARNAGLVGPFITIAKLTIALVTTSTFVVLLTRVEGAVYRGLFAGVATSVAYMVYQLISSLAFGFGLPFTTSARWQIGLGLSRRYGLVRVTGFTEEPSFIATMLVGSVLLLTAFASRHGFTSWWRMSTMIGAIGLALCTSNNMFATIAIILGSWILIHRGRVTLVLASYYVAAILVTPYVLNRDITYYSRFSPYDIFLRSSPIDQIAGRGLGSYPAYFAREQVSFNGVDVASLASVWGGFLFDGGVLLAALVVWWIARVIRRSPWREGIALFAVLIMLSNYNSPWWPLVSLALAQCLVLQRKVHPWTTTSTSVDTLPDSDATLR